MVIPGWAPAGLEVTESLEGRDIGSLHGFLLCPSLGVTYPCGVPHTPVLGPLHGRGWVSHRIARQPDVSHPGCCHSAPKGYDLCWGYRKDRIRDTPLLPPAPHWLPFLRAPEFTIQVLFPLPDRYLGLGVWGESREFQMRVIDTTSVYQIPVWARYHRRL